MADRPILFSAPMVRALLDARKTQTRRVLSERNTLFNGRPWRDSNTVWDACDWSSAWVDDGPSPAGNPGPYLKVRWPYGALLSPPTDETLVARVYPTVQPGDRLWVREATTRFDHGTCDQWVWYRAGRNDVGGTAWDGIGPTCGEWPIDREGPGTGWPYNVPSIFMPRWASRITLIVERVRVERLQDISEEGAEAEGARPAFTRTSDPNWPICSKPRYRWGFEELWNTIHGPGSWDENPWVAAIKFQTILANIDSAEARPQSIGGSR